MASSDHDPRKAAGFAHVQNHGMHLGRMDYADRLVDADVESHDWLTQVRGAWDKMMRGKENLDRYDHVKLITNSVISTRSYMLVPGMAHALSHLRRS